MASGKITSRRPAFGSLHIVGQPWSVAAGEVQKAINDLMLAGSANIKSGKSLLTALSGTPFYIPIWNAAGDGFDTSVIRYDSTVPLLIVDGDAEVDGDFNAVNIDADDLVSGARLNIGSGAVTAQATVAADNSANLLKIIGTLPTTPSAAVYGTYIGVTSAGSVAQEQSGLRVDLLGGYSGAANTIALDVNNASNSAGGGVNTVARLLATHHNADKKLGLFIGVPSGTMRIAAYIGLGGAIATSYNSSGTNGSCCLYVDRAGTGAPYIAVGNGSTMDGEWKSAVIYLGSTAAGQASPGAGTISGGVGAGTDKTAGGLVIDPGASTGSATPASITLRSYVATGSGTTAQTPFAAITIAAGGDIQIRRTVTAAGTTGNQTIDKAGGTVNIAAAGTTVTVTNNLVTANSIVHCVLRTNDATAWIKNVVPTAGSFTINLGAAATAEVSIGFLVTN